MPLMTRLSDSPLAREGLAEGAEPEPVVTMPGG
jgi:hypothetical protein